MFHHLVGVPSPVKDALQAASDSTSSNSSRSLRSVHIEIENAFQYVPPLVKDALDAANTSARVVMDENLATLYLCINEEFDKLKHQYEGRIDDLEREIKTLKSRGKADGNTLNLVVTKQQLADQVSAGGQRKTPALVRKLPTQANKILEAQPDHDRNSSASPKLLSSMITNDATQDMKVKLHPANEIFRTQNAFAYEYATLMSNRNMMYDASHHPTLPILQANTTLPSLQEKPGNNHHHVPLVSRDSGSLELIVKAMEQAGCNADESTQKTTHEIPVPQKPNQATVKSLSKKTTIRYCAAPECENRVVQGGLCISHGGKRKTCAVPGCTKRVKQQGKCSAHGPERKKCDAEGCTKVAVQGGRCLSHGAKKKKKICEVEGCVKLSITSGMCRSHYSGCSPRPMKRKISDLQVD